MPCGLPARGRTGPPTPLGQGRTLGLGAGGQPPQGRTGPKTLGRDHKPLDGTTSPWGRMGPSPLEQDGTHRPPPQGPLTAAPRVASVPRGGHSRCPARPVTAGDTVRPLLSGADSRRGAGAAGGTRPPLVQHPLGDSVPRDRVSRRVTPARPVPSSASGSQKYPRSPKIARECKRRGGSGDPRAGGGQPGHPRGQGQSPGDVAPENTAMATVTLPGHACVPAAPPVSRGPPRLRRGTQTPARGDAAG